MQRDNGKGSHRTQSRGERAAPVGRPAGVVGECEVVDLGHRASTGTVQRRADGLQVDVGDETVAQRLGDDMQTALPDRLATVEQHDHRPGCVESGPGVFDDRREQRRQVEVSAKRGGHLRDRRTGPSGVHHRQPSSPASRNSPSNSLFAMMSAATSVMDRPWA